MRRVPFLAALTALALGAAAPTARAGLPAAPAGGEVTALSIMPAGGRAEIVVAVGGAVNISDFTLESPDRIVMDLHGATLTMPPRLYDKVRRGAVTNVRIAQYADDIVRVVIELDRSRTYTVTRTESDVRVRIDGEGAQFTAWHGGEQLGTPAAAAGPAATGSRVGERSDTRAVGAPARAGGRATAPRAADQPRITVTYTESDIRDVIAAFSTFAGRTIIIGKGVEGIVTAEVRDQPWDVALRAILNSQGLAAREDQDGIITVDSYENIARQQATEPVTTQIVAVNYARASSLIETVRGLLSRNCLATGPGGTENQSQCTVRGNVAADSSTNRLIITDVPSRIQDIANYVKELDVRTPQVAIKAKIIFVNRTNIEDLGISYDLGSKDAFFNRLVQRTDPSTFKPVDTDGDGVPDRLGGGTPYAGTQPQVTLGGNALAAIANANQRVVQPALEVIFSTALGKFDLTAFVDALQEVRLADIQAEPSIVTLDNRPAQILSGEETPIRVIDAGAQQGGGNNQQLPRATVQFKETGIILRVTPHVTNNRQVLMTIHSERSNIQAAASDLGYTFQKQSAQNQLLVGDGETAVIGGLTVTQVSQSKAGIPLLVDLPLVGRLFGQTRIAEEKRDLLILVTPHIVDEGEQLQPPGGGR